MVGDWINCPEYSRSKQQSGNQMLGLKKCKGLIFQTIQDTSTKSLESTLLIQLCLVGLKRDRWMQGFTDCKPQWENEKHISSYNHLYALCVYKTATKSHKTILAFTTWYTMTFQFYSIQIYSILYYIILKRCLWSIHWFFKAINWSWLAI